MESTTDIIDVAIITCKQFVDLTGDDKRFHQALQEKGVKVAIVMWDDKSTK